jgi:hypothetical protein
MEVVLPNGELLRTGMGAIKDNKTIALYKGYVVKWVQYLTIVAAN